jgi:hypothetical protein
MNAFHQVDRDRLDPADKDQPTGQGLESLATFCARVDKLRLALLRLARIGDKETKKAALRLVHHLNAIEPSVTMIGQVKSGKTSLVNAMIGVPGLLPADVNPWTSVVTTLHLSPPAHDIKQSARFRFFDEGEWNRLIESGGRIGELASRAGADDELEKVRAQINEMRAKSRKRLGRKFELLLGQEHDYGYVDQDLIQRYVCLGDDFEDAETGSTQGRFADITKSADIFLPSPRVPMRLCIRDTPGVNDTFMMREQITINAIRDSRLCVVVLSAHQALTSMDMALVRLISNVKSREVLIFVNRIDELAHPAVEVAEIRKRIVETFAACNGPSDPQIIFGSALWANACLAGRLGSLPSDSAAALLNWAEVATRSTTEQASTRDIVAELSGIPELYRAISDRIVEGLGQEAVQRIARSALNLAKGVLAADRVIAVEVNRKSGAGLSSEQAIAAFDRLQSDCLAGLTQAISVAMADYSDRLDRAHRSFLERATSALITHLERFGENSPWHYSPDGLRILLRSNYLKFGNGMQKAAQSELITARTALADLFAKLVDCPPEQFHIEIPADLRVPPPVTLGQTIALDLQGSWWKSWWFRRRGYQAFAGKFHDLIKSETDPMLHDLRVDQAEAICAGARQHVEHFLQEQRDILLNVARKADASPTDLRDMFGLQAQDDRRSALQSTIETFTRFAT